MKKIWFIGLIILGFSQVVKANKIVDEAATQYVRLVLALGQHDKNYVDAYYGPEIWQTKASQSKMELANIIIAGKLIQDVVAEQRRNPDNQWNDLELLRLSYLDAQLTALVARAIMLKGEIKYSFARQAKELFDTQPPTRSLQSFNPILVKLDELIPGKQPLTEKLANFNRQFEIPKDRLAKVFKAAIDECRVRTKQAIPLPEKESFTLEYVQDKPWSGYNWYQGKGHSLIQVNDELPIPISRAVDLGCHEGYPGHHVYNSLLEQNLYQKQGWIEYSVYPLFSPQSLIAEGSANYGIAMAFPGDEKLAFEKNVLFPLAGIETKLAEQYAKVTELVQQLSYAGNEVARQYLEKEIDATQAQKLLQEYALMSEAKAKQRVKFIEAYGAYVINYNWGKDLVKQWIESDPQLNHEQRWQKFYQLLSTPRLPSTLN
ncbi:hypothetical protein ACUR5C_16115 [Aliikangiella sp. IMCC44653]